MAIIKGKKIIHKHRGIANEGLDWYIMLTPQKLRMQIITSHRRGEPNG